MREASAAAILLAAGRSSRFGGPKLLAGLAGRPLLDHAAELVGALSRDGTLACAVAVVGPDSPAVNDILCGHGIEPVQNPDPAEGLASSLRAGITELQKRKPVPDAVLIFLADQPKVQADTVHTILSAWRTGAKPVVRPRYS
ncbi:MAG: nucleotidyltransferase family protein, partial [Gemmatimonadales bacterium]